jgi:NAD-dependent DNA ligase
LQIEAPKNCPSCNSELEWTNNQIYCRNDACPAKSNKQLEHFAKTLKIKGLGPITIEKLNITTIFELYDMSLDYITLKLKSEKTAIKLFNEINNSKNEPLNTILPAFGIPLVGNSATGKLATNVNSIFDIDKFVCIASGIGPKATENLMTWLNNNLEKYSELPFNFKFSEKQVQIENIGVVCISGKLNSYPTKAVAKDILEAAGYKVKDSITKEVTILVNESGVETAKTKKAVADGIIIVTNLKEYMENI